MFIECAVALNASHIVSGEKALLRVARYFDVVILSPHQYVDLPQVSRMLTRAQRITRPREEPPRA